MKLCPRSNRGHPWA